MALNKREKLIAISLGALLAVVGANSLLIGPYRAHRDQLVLDIAAMEDKDATADKVMTNRPKVSENWAKMLKSGLKTNPSDAEIAAVQAFYDWSQSVCVAIDSVNSDQDVRVGDFQQVRITALVRGNMAGEARWLWSLENTPLPLQVGDVQLNTRKEGTDDLNMQVTVTAIAFAPLPPKGSTGNQNAAGAK